MQKFPGAALGLKPPRFTSASATAPQAIAAGADVLVAGTATFKGGPGAYADNIRRLRGGA